MYKGIYFKKYKAYGTWKSMRGRCYQQSMDCYPDYGGRGITVCDRWLGKDGFKHFIDDMGERPEGMTLDRINVNGNYEPSNCRWAKAHQQNWNRRGMSDHIGVFFEDNQHLWRAKLMVKGVFVLNEVFNNFDDAMAARKAAVEKYVK
jgi:hypothetical protein